MAPIGTAIVRWPGPILVVATAVALVGLLALPGYKTSYDTRPYLPGQLPRPTSVTRPPSDTSPSPAQSRTVDDRD